MWPWRCRSWIPWSRRSPAQRRFLPGLSLRSRTARRGGSSPSATTWAFCTSHFFPKEAGKDYTLSPYLQFLKDHRNDFTVMSGVSHPNVDGGHPSDIAFLTAAPHPASGSFRNSISLDQLIAERIGNLTRFPSLTLGVNVGARGLSWTRTAVAIPPEERASGVFKQLFLQGTPEEIDARIRELDTGQSILDAVADQTRDLQRDLGSRDRSRLDQYLSSVRDLEHRLQESKGWERKPKPVVKVTPPVDPASPAQYMEKAPCPNWTVVDRRTMRRLLRYC